MSFCEASSMHPAITHRHSHVLYIMNPSSAGADHGSLYETAPNENWTVEVRFRSGGP